MTKEILGYVHSDLWDSMSNEEILPCCKYFLMLIDDFSKRVWMRFLRSKNEAYENISEWKPDRRLSVLEQIMGSSFVTTLWTRCVKKLESKDTRLVLILHSIT